jgi:hypothetical protein
LAKQNTTHTPHVVQPHATLPFSGGLEIITYSKGRHGREAFSFHPSVPSSYREENPGRNK